MRRRQPGHRGGAVGEVRVQVADVAGPRQPVGDVGGLQELLEVDRARPPAAPGPRRLPPAAAAARASAQRVPAGDPRAAPAGTAASCRAATAAAARRTATWSPAGTTACASMRSTTGWCSASSAGLSTNSRSGMPELLQPPDLAGDEQLGDAAGSPSGRRRRWPACVRHTPAPGRHAAARCSGRRPKSARRAAAGAAAELGARRGGVGGERGRARRPARPGRPAATSRPVTPSTHRAAGSRRRRWPTTGRPLAIASSTTLGSPSRSPSASTTDGTTTTWAAAYSAGSSSCVSAPTSSTRSPSPCAAIRSRQRVAARGPSPTIRSRYGRVERASASSSTSKPFFAHQPADGEQAQRRSPAGGGRGREAVEVDAVRDQRRRGAGAADVGRRRRGCRRRRSAASRARSRQAVAADLARVEGVDAEAVRDAEAPGGPRGDLGGRWAK